MIDNIQIPPNYSGQAILDRLDNVLDPELDESVLKLGFIDTVQVKNGHLTVIIHFPTFWCAQNFAFMMAEDIRNEMLQVEGIENVTVRLKDHASAATIEAGVNSDKSFAETYSDETSGDLGELRKLFLRKGGRLFILNRTR